MKQNAIKILKEIEQHAIDTNITAKRRKEGSLSLTGLRATYPRTYVPWTLAWLGESLKKLGRAMK